MPLQVTEQTNLLLARLGVGQEVLDRRVEVSQLVPDQVTVTVYSTKLESDPAFTGGDVMIEVDVETLATVTVDVDPNGDDSLNQALRELVDQVGLPE